MTLKEYRAKRNFKKTSEPPPEVRKSDQAPHFCVQKHAATRLHYDFRLEYRGVLLSWAVPKGPSLNPKDKRLAIQVEDHPLEYQYFEGIIPKGNYGAGTVEIWDHGTYSVPTATTKRATNKILAEGLKKGHFSVDLRGEKLNGIFVFQKLKSDPSDNAWLLIKQEDAYADSEKKVVFSSHSGLAKKAKMPAFFTPMLATLIDKPFSDEDWLFEIKWDGFRALAFITPRAVQLKSRAGNLLNDKFQAIVRELEKIKGKLIFDGEIVVLDDEGISRFQLMQNYQKTGRGNLCYYVYDLLYKDDLDLRQLPLVERKEMLRKILKALASPWIRFSDHILKDGTAFFKEVSKKHLEGMIGKQKNSSYESRRSREWVKVKTGLRQEVVIGGFTEPRGSRKKFGALLVGVYNQKGELHYAGHVGGGFTTTLLDDVYAQLKPLIQAKSPFKEKVKGNANVSWVKPQLVCEVSFAEWTDENIMRQPIFQGMRMDKKPKAVKQEIAISTPIEEPSETIALTNLDKIYWPKEKYTKKDLIDYYKDVAPYILPYLKDRPITLHRYPNGIEGEDFYQKDIKYKPPKGIETFAVVHEGEIYNYLLINDINSLMYAVNLGSIDIHPFISRCQSLNYPDYSVIDLDPHDIEFERVVEAALVTHELLEEIGIKHFCKTSGGKGLHIFIPLHGKYEYEQSRQFANIVALKVHERLPDTTSLIRNPKKREKKIYLDYLQNKLGQTIVAPYAVRPRPGAKVSTPLDWSEVNKKLDPGQFTIKTVPKRLKKKGDLFTGILGRGINLEIALKKLNKLSR